MAPPSDATSLAVQNWAAREAADARPSPAALQPAIGHHIHAVARLIRRRFERSVRQSGLPITRLQAAVLLYIARNEGANQTAAAGVLDIDPIALVRMLDRLHEEGLVERRPHPTDRRARTLWLTPLGWPVIERILQINLTIREEACAGLTPAARAMLIDTLEQMKSNLDIAEDGDGDAAETA
jgi:MarR family transcriptional regulator, transcriptional regulator for hemolysin